MTRNLDNAVRRVREARASIFVETGREGNTSEQMDDLEDIQMLLNKVEDKMREYGN